MKNKINVLELTGYIFFIIILLLISFFIGSVFQFELTYNLFKLNKSNVNKDIIIVELDEKTINSEDFPRYQDINRSHYATVFNRILFQNPKTLGVDITFFGSSANKEHDEKLKKVLDKYGNKIVLNNEIIKENDGTPKVLNVGFGYQNAGYADLESSNDLNIYNIPLKDIKNSFPIYFEGLNTQIPFSFAVYKNVNNISNTNITNKSLIFGNGLEVPLAKIGNEKYSFVNFYTKNYSKVSFIDIYKNNIADDLFTDKVVFIGATASDIHDEFYTPFNRSAYIPGVIIHANMYNTLTTGQFLKYQDRYSFAITQIIFIILFLILVLKSKNAIFGLVYSGLTLIIYIVGSAILFIKFGYFIEILPIIVCFILVNLLVFIKRFFQESKKRAEITNMFGKYVSKDVVSQIVNTGLDSLGLGGTNKYVTIFFSDLVGFTDLSEDLDPENLGKILNIYFETMSNIILEQKGTIDKFIGDALMAFRNAPIEVNDHENLACETALMQRKALDIVRMEVKRAGSNCEVDMRIGINSGIVVVGNFGCSQRYDYTILGDSVNLGARLESINKQYGTRIMINETTYAKINHEKYLTRNLDCITVKGKVKPVKIYELICFRQDADKETLENVENFEKAFKLYQSQKFEKAIEVFAKIGDPPSQVFIKRCEEFINNPPKKDWDGVFRFKVK